MRQNPLCSELLRVESCVGFIFVSLDEVSEGIVAFIVVVIVFVPFSAWVNIVASERSDCGWLHKVDEESKEHASNSPNVSSIIETFSTNISFSGSFRTEYWARGDDVGLDELPACLDEEDEDNREPFVYSQMDPHEIEPPCNSEVGHV